MPKKEEKLSPKQKAFIREYLIHRNATKAAKNAGYKGDDASLASIGAQNLRKLQISNAIQSSDQKVAEKYNITHERIIQEIASIAFGNVSELASWDEDNMTFVPSDDLTTNQKKFVESIKKEEIKYGKDMTVTTVSMKTLASHKLKALEMLGKIEGVKGLGKDSDAGNGDDKGNRSDVLSRVSKFLRKPKA